MRHSSTCRVLLNKTRNIVLITDSFIISAMFTHKVIDYLVCVRNSTIWRALSIILCTFPRLVITYIVLVNSLGPS